MKSLFTKLILLFSYTLLITLLFSSNAFAGIYADSNVFFLCGKGLAEGLIPYVDFTDSKGPFLWLIYGIGYIISPTNYWGVYYLEVFFSFTTLCIAYKTLRLWLDSKLSFFSTLLCGIFLYYFGFHEETATETFCMPFLMMTMYIFSTIVFGVERINRNRLFFISFLIGISISATMLIKYNMAVMIILVGIVPLIKLCKEYKLKIVVIAILSSFIGFIVFSLPFIVFLIRVSAFIPFLKEYFLATAVTANNLNQIPYQGAFNCLSMRTAYWGAVLLYVIASIISSFIIEKVFRKIFLPISLLLSLLVLGINGIFCHYYEPLFVFLPVLIGVFLSRIQCKHKTIVIIICVLFSLMSNFYKYCARAQYPLTHKKYYQSQMEICNTVDSILSEKNHPKIMLYGSFNGKWGVRSMALPGCRYFIPQAGMTESMRISIEQSINNGEPDYIIVPYGLFVTTYTHDWFYKSGYKCVLDYEKDTNQNVKVYKKSI